ncbi:MAG TPA: hypothetical protein VKN35_04915 [Xanthomonadales bacterium]|nr:hypothetical protein [Xanthomonadales bacterium]
MNRTHPLNSMARFSLPGVLLLATIADSRAGPPLAIDDPGILDPGQWEFILAVDGVDFEFAKAYNLPIVDVSYGVTENSQLSFSLPRIQTHPAGGEKQSGLGFASIGYKWRFFSNGTTDWAIAPSYNFPASHQVIQKGGPEDIRALAVPLLYSRSMGNWTALGQLGFNLGSDGSQAWDFGVALTHPLGSRTELMIEVYGVADSSFNYETLNYHIGLDYAFVEDFHLLASYGSQLKAGSELAERLNFNFYLGLQWFY